jgi:hypothetical protein
MDNALSLLPVNASKALMALPVKISAKHNRFKPKILPIKMAAKCGHGILSYLWAEVNYLSLTT